jgi:hypothetical protein
MLQPKKSFWGTKPGFDVGDVLHIFVNVLFVAVIYAMVAFWNLTPLAIILVILSKWRILAVQPRFWLPNIKANLVDLIVGISTIILTFEALHSWVAVFWMLLYLAWLLFLKPQAQDIWVGMQAFWAQLIGLTALFVSPNFIRQTLVVCGLAWLICWAAARHYFSNYEEPHYRTLGLVWGFFMSQLIWISLHWVQYYIVFGTKLVTIAIVVGIISAALGSIYHAYKREVLQRAVIIENSLFAGALLMVVLVTSKWSTRL